MVQSKCTLSVVAPQRTRAVGDPLRENGIKAANQVPLPVIQLHAVVVSIRHPNPSPAINPKGMGQPKPAWLRAGTAHGSQKPSIHRKLVRRRIAIAVRTPDRAVGRLHRAGRPVEGHSGTVDGIKVVGVTHLCGGEYLVGPGLLFGSDGNISGATNLFPELFVELYDAAQLGDLPAVRVASEKIALIHTAAAQTSAWLAAFKHICARMGLMQPLCAAGQPTLTEAGQRDLDAFMDTLEGL